MSFFLFSRKVWHGICYYLVITNTHPYMTDRFSELVQKYKTQSQFDKWVDARKKEIKELAYENRSVIEKRSVENTINDFDNVKKAFKRLNTLRKKSEDYDAVIIIDKEGYTRFRVYFPITQQELDKSIEYRREHIAELGKWGSACISLDDAVWSVLHEKVYKTFNFTRPVKNIESFEKYGSGLVRKMEIFGFC